MANAMGSLKHSVSANGLRDMKDSFDHIFSDQELEVLLNRVAASEGAHEDVLNGMLTDAPLGLQFLPPEVPGFQQGQNLLNGASHVSSFEELPRSASAAAAAAAAAAQANAAALSNLHALMGNSQHGGHTAVDALSLATSGMAQALPSPLTQTACNAFASAPMSTASTRTSKGNHDLKPMISHSTVEKQRRDRINSLIDELRDIVPPSKATMAAAAGAAGGAVSAKDANTEARRPKHVVLADTIALLKQLAQRGPLTLLLAASQPGGTSTRLASGDVDDPMLTAADVATAVPLPAAAAPADGAAIAATAAPVEGGAKVKLERQISPSNSNSKGSVSSHKDMEMKDDGRTAAPKLPVIPIQPTQMSGVVVEQGPDCMYVQVKCRDRKGLLLDIINAMKQLPMEVRTAAVTTQNGLVRDVFEVQVDDPSLKPVDVQNMVHEALFQQWQAGEKRARC